MQLNTIKGKRFLFLSPSVQAQKERDAAELAKQDADQQRDAALHQTYIVNIKSAQTAITNLNFSIARSRLATAHAVKGNPPIDTMPRKI